MALNIPINGYLLIEPGVQSTDRSMDCFPTLKSAMEHRGDKEWAVVAWLSIENEQAKLVTVAYFNCPVTAKDALGAEVSYPAKPIWTTVRSY